MTTSRKRTTPKNTRRRVSKPSPRKRNSKVASKTNIDDDIVSLVVTYSSLFEKHNIKQPVRNIVITAISTWLEATDEFSRSVVLSEANREIATALHYYVSPQDYATVAPLLRIDIDIKDWLAIFENRVLNYFK